MKVPKKFLINDLTDKIENKNKKTPTYKSGKAPIVQDPGFRAFLIEEIQKDDARKSS